MEKIVITYSPEGKSTASRLQQVLKNTGFASSLLSDRLGSMDNPDMVIAIITKDTDSDSKSMQLFADFSDRCINVIPFVTEALPDTVTSRFFLDEHVWMDAVQQPFEEAARDLVDCLKRNYPLLKAKAEKKSSKTQQKLNKPTVAQQGKKTAESNPTKKETLYRNLLIISGVVILVMLFVLISGGTGQLNREASIQQASLTNSQGKTDIKIQLPTNLKKSEAAFVGTWKMQSYSDNQFRPTHEDTVQLHQLVDALVSRAQLVFNADKTFSRLGFSDTPESGSWEFDSQSNYLKLQPNGVNQVDVVHIQEVTDNTLTIVVQEGYQNNQIITKLVFQRIK
ncbi:MAG: hypothetical protein MJZ61_04650 [Bacteroidales bacterium]|nr:hypothetical protein [Bacteroidales bacterium]